MRNWLAALSILAPLAGHAKPDFTLTVLHTNDIHARVESSIVARKPYGGYAKMATLIKRYRATDPNPLVLNAGDTFQGTLYYNVYKGLADVHLMNLSGYQAMALGNHEFDDGPQGLAPFARNARFPLLSANLDFSREPLLRDLIKPSVILTVGGQRIGIIGLMTPDLAEISSPGPTITMKPLDAALRAEITKLTNQRVNKIVVVSHMGFAAETALAKRHPDVDIVVGGHSHTLLCNSQIEGFPAPAGTYPTLVGNTVVVQAWEWGKILGRIKVEFDAAGVVTGYRDNAVIVVDEKVPEDHAVAAAVDAFRKPIEQLQSQPVGMTEKGISRDPMSGETPMGNVIADAQLSYVAKQATVMAFMNAGGVRAPIEPGPITFGEIIAVQPFGNTLVVMDVTGAAIKAMLEVSAGKGMAVQVSNGVRYRISKNSPSGEKITQLSLNSTPIEMDKTYRIVVNNFMSRGGDGFTSLAEAKGYRLDTGFLDSDALIEYVKKNNPTEMGLQGRIIIE